jgi:glycosyltransferase involved in cell wall biosynthesis
VQSSAPKLLYVVNIPRFFITHRLPLALAAQQAGFDVHVATSDHDTENVQHIIDSGLPFHPLPLSQHGTSPLTELRTINAIRKLYKELNPNLIHHVSIKPVIYGGIAAKLTGHKAVVSAMSGLGYVFIGTGLKPFILRQLVRPALKIALAGETTRMVFQNPDDRQLFIDRGLVNPSTGILIRGSGVDETYFSPQPEPEDGLPIVLFAGRLLWQKGVGEFAELARRLQGQARFVFVGYEETTSPVNVPTSQLEAWRDEGIIEWWGKRDDMPDVYAQANIVCLPSTYGEGVPKVLIEASSCERASVTTDTAGCREIIKHGVNGLLVPPHDLDALTSAVEHLIHHPEERQQMGKNGREIVLNDYTFKQVADETFTLYRVLLSN